MAGTHRKVLSCATLTGDRVQNRAHEDLGKIDDLMIDLDTGRIAYAVLSFGGILGIGDKLFAIPWDVLSLSQDEHMFILDVPKEKLESAPGFDKDHWPDMADPQWTADISSFYGTGPVFTGSCQEGLTFDEKRRVCV
jgi:sporulation protein YlmC with PRC-barrel domain